MLWIVDGGMISLPVIARVEDFKEDSYIEITGADENHKWKSEPTRYEAVTHCKDCKHGIIGHGIEDGLVLCSKPFAERGNAMHRSNWYCADGKRREQIDD